MARHVVESTWQKVSAATAHRRTRFPKDRCLGCTALMMCGFVACLSALSKRPCAPYEQLAFLHTQLVMREVFEQAKLVKLMLCEHVGQDRLMII